jgi:threonine/homoserine/homoserine lactone efflux protein
MELAVAYDQRGRPRKILIVSGAEELLERTEEFAAKGLRVELANPQLTSSALERLSNIIDRAAEQPGHEAVVAFLIFVGVGIAWDARGAQIKEHIDAT